MLGVLDTNLSAMQASVGQRHTFVGFLNARSSFCRPSHVFKATQQTHCGKFSEGSTQRAHQSRHSGTHTRASPTQARDFQGPDALLFDCDGVLVDTEAEGHRIAFNKAFKEKGDDQCISGLSSKSFL